MKKTYQIPATTVQNIELQQMIASSLGASEKAANPESGMLSRRGGYVWDDEDEEEDY